MESAEKRREGTGLTDGRFSQQMDMDGHGFHRNGENEGRSMSKPGTYSRDMSKSSPFLDML